MKDQVLYVNDLCVNTVILKGDDISNIHLTYRLFPTATNGPIPINNSAKNKGEKHAIRERSRWPARHSSRDVHACVNLTFPPGVASYDITLPPKCPT